MAIEFMGAIGAVQSVFAYDAGANNRKFSDTDITGIGGAELFNQNFGTTLDAVSKPIDWAFTWSADTPAAYFPMRSGAFDAFDRGGSQDVRCWMPKLIPAAQGSLPFASRFMWFNLKSTPESAMQPGDVALKIVTDPANSQFKLRISWRGTAGLWIDGTVTTNWIADDTILRVVVKADLSGANPILTLYTGDGTATSMNSVSNTLNGANDPSVAQVTAQTTPECTVGYQAIGKNNGFGMGVFDYTVADATSGDSWNGYAWTSANGGTAVEERAWERVPIGDGDDDAWIANGNAANCTGKHNTVDDEYHIDDGGDGANDYISATDPAGGAAVQQLFTYQALDGSADPDGIAVVAVVRDHSKDADYSCHWKDSGGTERQKAMVKGYENGTAGTTLWCWLPTQAGTAGVSDWTHANVEAAQFGVQLDSDASADGRVYGYHILVLGDSFGAQSDVVVCPAATTHIRAGVAIGSANAMTF